MTWTPPLELAVILPAERVAALGAMGPLDRVVVLAPQSGRIARRIARIAGLDALTPASWPKHEWPPLIQPVSLLVREPFRLEALWDTAAPRALTKSRLGMAPVWFEGERGPPINTTRSQHDQPFGRLRPASHMPLWAARVALDIHSVHGPATISAAGETLDIKCRVRRRDLV